MASDKTEQPTSKRLSKLREQGQLPQSRDLLQGASFVAVVMALAWFGSGMTSALQFAITHFLARVGQTPMAPIDGAVVGGITVDGVLLLIRVCGPLAFASVVSVVAIQMAFQKGIVWSPQAITLNFNALNPANGIKKLGFTQGGYELIKAVIVSTALVMIGWQTVEPFVSTGARLSRIAVAPAAVAGWDIAMGMFKKMAVLLVVAGVADYAYQKWRFMQRNRMTKQEVQDEQRQADGNPETKGRIRRIQRMLLKRRMLAAVPKATLVITNPTHYAMALEYRRGVMPAPRVVAKGKNLVAQRIKAIAREHGVPIVENPPLAQALYKSVDVGDLIPGALFDAVAEVLAYLIRLKQLVL